MRQSTFTVARTRRLTRDVWELVLAGDASAVAAPGQFVNIRLPGKFLRRPISVCDWTEDTLTLLVKEAGEAPGGAAAGEGPVSYKHLTLPTSFTE